jgi:hypothetical protein
MKTAEEIFEKYVLTVECSNDEGLTISEERTTMMDIIGFEKALADYKQSIIGLIDKRMNQDEQMRLKYMDKDLQKYAIAKISAYHELKQKIETL